MTIRFMFIGVTLKARFFLLVYIHWVLAKGRYEIKWFDLS